MVGFTLDVVLISFIETIALIGAFTSDNTFWFMFFSIVVAITTPFYFMFFQYFYGKTLGMKAVGTVVFYEKEEALSSLFLRNILFFVDNLIWFSLFLYVFLKLGESYFLSSAIERPSFFLFSVFYEYERISWIVGFVFCVSSFLVSFFNDEHKMAHDFFSRTMIVPKALTEA